MERCCLSIIMPIYNSGEYLSATLENVLAQNYEKYELILVDDGSTDGSGALCDEFAERDPRIRVIHQKNAGLSAARNAGLDAAEGEYVGFVDSDDLIEPEMFSTLTGIAAQYDADIVQCRHDRLDSVQGVTYSGGERIVDGRTFVREIFEHEGKEATNQVAQWSKIYRRELFDGVRLPVGRYFEDEWTTYRICLKADKIVLIHDELYHYVKRENSIITAATAKSLRDKQDALADRMAFLPKLLPELEEKCVRSFLGYSEHVICRLYERHEEEMLHEAIDAVMVNWKAVKPHMNKYEKIYFPLLRFECGRNWILKNEFEPIQNILRKMTWKK